MMSDSVGNELLQAADKDSDTSGKQPPPAKCRWLLNIGVEPSLFLYMVSSFVRFPAFQALVYEMVCNNLNPHSDICSNSTLVRKDLNVQLGSNHMILASTLTLTVPSLCVSAVLGSLSDKYSRKLSLLIPFLGLVLSDMAYLTITSMDYKSINPYWLITSDLVFGLSGGFIGILGTMFAYSASQTSISSTRSYRMAVLEGCIGGGGTVGYLSSGYLIRELPYSYVFLLVNILNALCFFGIVIFVRDSKNEVSLEVSNDTVLSRAWCHLRNSVYVAFKQREGANRICLLLLLISLAISFTVFSGSSDILFYYMKYKLGWTPVQYGKFSGIVFFLGTVAILSLYPILRRYCLSDYQLAIFGMVSKSIGCLMLAFVFSDWFAYTSRGYSHITSSYFLMILIFLSVSIVYCLNRFASAAVRSLISQIVDKTELGQIFAFVSLLQGLCTLLASAVFNNLLPFSLSFFPGFSFCVMCVCLLIAIACVLSVQYIRKNS